jgi:S-formylglutathione hydrolase FrmB
MKKKLFISFLICFTNLYSWAGKVITDSIQSTVLDSTILYNVYLPDGFETTDRKFPVVYLLHGLSDTYRAWNDKSHMKEIADELIGTGEATPMVIIMPNAGHPDIHHQWNGYFDMPGWKYETFFFTELLPTVERKYKIIGDKQHRAIMGLSMGGGGSTVYCQRHPEMFSSCYAMSAWLSSDEPKVGENGKDKLYLVTQSVYEKSATDFLANADEATKEKLRTVRWFFDCGDDDGLMGLSVKMHELSIHAGIKDELRIRNGGHNWEYWNSALRTALPFASQDFRK